VAERRNLIALLTSPTKAMVTLALAESPYRESKMKISDSERNGLSHEPVCVILFVQGDADGGS